MRTNLGRIIAFVVVLVSSAIRADAGEVYADPDGGWAYIYDGLEAEAGADGDGFTSLDGTWSHDNSSDQWDSGFITDGENSPGGILPIEDDYTYLRLQDPGDPRDHGFADPGSNRKLYFIHDIGEDGADDTVMDTGITMTFRARVPTSGPFDDAHPDGGGAVSAWDPNGVGDGYVLHDGGKSSFTVSQNGGDASSTISFALAMEEEDRTGFGGLGLAMNSSSGGVVSGDVDWQGDEGEPNLFPLDDPTEWQEFWINIFANPNDRGTHTVVIYANGEVDEPTTFDVTAGTGRDYDGNYIAMGLGATPQMGVLDVDFFGWIPGLIPPTANDIGETGCDFNTDGVCDISDIDELMYTGLGTEDAKYDLDGSGGTIDLADRDAWLREAGSLPGDANLSGVNEAGDLNAVGSNWQSDSSTSWAQGDYNGDGSTNAQDLNTLGTWWTKSAADFAAAEASAAAVPEPSAGCMLLILMSGLSCLRRKR